MTSFAANRSVIHSCNCAASEANAFDCCAVVGGRAFYISAARLSIRAGMGGGGRGGRRFNYVTEYDSARQASSESIDQT